MDPKTWKIQSSTQIEIRILLRAQIFFVDVSKYTIGRLRPHFLSVCNVTLDDVLCKDDNDYLKFVVVEDEELCTNFDGTDAKVFWQCRHD